jgi:hypothetical protein
LYSEEVAGFYDPKRKQMYLIKEVETPGEKPGLIARLLGIGTGFNKDEQKTTLSHEMSHALADQNFDLLKMQDVAEKDDDRSLALQALIEGEATLVMMLDMERATGGTGRDLLDASPALIDFSLSLASAFIPFASSNAFLQAPPILRESMLFPYFKGMVFLLHMTNDSGWGRVNEAFRKPPLSTEQVLHPEKYLREVDEPTEIVLPPLGDVLGSGWKEVGQNVLGELQISILLRMQQGVRAAAGWDGDRYAVFSGPGNKLGMVWYSTWDSDAEAREFASAYSRYRSLPPDSTEVVVLNPVPDHVRVEQQGRLYDMTRRNSDVVTIEGFSVEETEKLVQTLFTASKRAKK